MKVIVMFAVAAVSALAFFLLKKVEQPKYSVVEKYDNIEIRKYEPLIKASTIIAGTKESSLNKGFRKLAAYISKNNIKMTAPVMINSNDDKWQISFIMPRKTVLKDLPINPDIILSSTPEKKYIVISFSGSSSEENFKHQELLFNKFIEKKQIKTTGKIVHAYYNPPWTLPIFKRNEVFKELIQK